MTGSGYRRQIVTAVDGVVGGYNSFVDAVVKNHAVCMVFWLLCSLRNAEKVFQPLQSCLAWHRVLEVSRRLGQGVRVFLVFFGIR